MSCSVSPSPVPARDLNLVWSCGPEGLSCIDSFWPLHPATMLAGLFDGVICYGCSDRARLFLAESTPALVPTVLDQFEVFVLETLWKLWLEPEGFEAAVMSVVEAHEFHWSDDDRRTELVEWLSRVREFATGELDVDDVVNLGDFPMDLTLYGRVHMAFIACLALSTLVVDEAAWVDEVIRVGSARRSVGRRVTVQEWAALAK